jgi:hypothetical protein
MIARTTCVLLVGCLRTTAAFADAGLAAYAGEDGSVDTERQCDVYIAGVATSPHPDPLRYRWLDGTVALTRWSDVRADRTAPVELCGLSVGRHVLTLEVTDGKTTVAASLIAIIEPSAPNLASAHSTEEPAR